MEQRRPLPETSADTGPFWEGCREHILRFQKCADCGHVRWPPSILCPLCHCHETEWIQASGRGKVYTYAVYHQAFYEAFRGELPFVAAYVELEEGPRLLCNIVGCDPAEVRCDMPVEVSWEDVNEDISLPQFRPLPSTGGSVSSESR